MAKPPVDFGDIFGDLFSQSRPSDQALLKMAQATIVERDAELVMLKAQVERLKRRARNNIDRAYNKGLDECGTESGTYRNVRHADEFGDDK